MKNKTFLIFLIIYLLLLLILIKLNVHIIRPHVEDIDQITIEIYDGFGNCTNTGTNLITAKNIGSNSINLEELYFVLHYDDNLYRLKVNHTTSEITNSSLKPQDSFNLDLNETYKAIRFKQNTEVELTVHKDYNLGRSLFREKVILF